MITYPAVHQDIAVVVDDQVPAAEVRAAVLEGGGELLRSAEVFDLYRGEQVGEGRKSLALRLTFRGADRTLTDEEVAERSSRSRPPSKIEGPSVIRNEGPGGRGLRIRGGAGGRAGAEGTRASSSSRVTARPMPAARLNELYPQYGVDLVLEDPARRGRLADVDAAIVAYPHGAAAPVVAALRDTGTKVVDLSADFRLHDLGDLRTLVRGARGAGAARRARSTG